MEATFYERRVHTDTEEQKSGELFHDGPRRRFIFRDSISRVVYSWRLNGSVNDRDGLFHEDIRSDFVTRSQIPSDTIETVWKYLSLERGHGFCIFAATGAAGRVFVYLLRGTIVH